jgi:adenosylhomocysteine nucleosidase
LDLDGVTLACATRTEARAARRLAAPTVVVGIGARRPVPDGPVVSFGIAGGLHDRLECGDVLDATRVVAADGKVLWEGAPLGVTGAKRGTILAADRIVDDPEERRTLHARTGADAVDMESGRLALSGRLAGCVRAVSDTPARTLGPVATIVGPDGRVRAAGLARALARPRETVRALRDVRRALRRLEEVAA